MSRKVSCCRKYFDRNYYIPVILTEKTCSEKENCSAKCGYESPFTLKASCIPVGMEDVTEEE